MKLNEPCQHLVDIVGKPVCLPRGDAGTADHELLLSEVRRNRRVFRAASFRRDSGEVGLALMLAAFSGLNAILGESWAWGVLAAACLWVATYIPLNRIRRRPVPLEATSPISEAVEGSLLEIERQIRQLGSVLWWQVLPPAVGVAAILAEAAWPGPHWTGPGAARLLGVLAATTAVLVAVHRANQRAVRNELLPRRGELLALRAALPAKGVATA